MLIILVWEKIYTGVVHTKFSLTGRDKFYTVKEKEMFPQILVTTDTVPLPKDLPQGIIPEIVSISQASLIREAIERILGE